MCLRYIKNTYVEFRRSRHSGSNQVKSRILAKISFLWHLCGLGGTVYGYKCQLMLRHDFKNVKKGH